MAYKLFFYLDVVILGCFNAQIDVASSHCYYYVSAERVIIPVIALKNVTLHADHGIIVSH